MIRTPAIAQTNPGLEQTRLAVPPGVLTTTDNPTVQTAIEDVVPTWAGAPGGHS